MYTPLTIYAKIYLCTLYGGKKMEFMYMDESGKNILTQSNQNLFVFGGLILNKDKVFDALTAYKSIYKRNRDAIKIRLNKGIITPDKGERIQKMLEKFEFHAVKIFNPNKQTVRKGRVIEENPWLYYPAAERFKLIHDVFINISPYITKVVMYKVEKASFLQYCSIKGLTPSDAMLTDKMIEFITDEYHEWLQKANKKGTIIADRLDSTIRDGFVTKINVSKHKHYWTEPITVESHLNAFTQIIDIITYCYYIVYTNATHKDNFNAVKNVYNTHIRKLLEEKDLVDFLNQNP